MHTIYQASKRCPEKQACQCKPHTCAQDWSKVTPTVKGEGYYNIYWRWSSPENVREQTWRLIHAWHSFVCQIGVDYHCLANGEGLRLWACRRSQPKMPAEPSDSNLQEVYDLHPFLCYLFEDTHKNTYDNRGNDIRPRHMHSFTQIISHISSFASAYTGSHAGEFTVLFQIQLLTQYL